MKVGTDGVLLGAWADVSEDRRLLDVGTGTGVIALMLAQRTGPDVRVDAVEIEEGAARQAGENFRLSPWKDRLSLWRQDFRIFARERAEAAYDHIVSNPPYFIGSLKSGDLCRTVARHAELLPYGDLIEGANRLLGEGGRLTAVFPYEEAHVFIALAAGKGFYCRRRLEVRGVARKPVKRVLLEFRRERGEVAEDALVIGGTEPDGYSAKYKALTRDFYLKF